MAHLRVGVYRKYLEPVPVDLSGQPLAPEMWPKKRRFCWVARWFGAQGKRFSRTFQAKAEARQFAEAQEALLQRAHRRLGPRRTLGEFSPEHRQLMSGNVARGTLALHLSTWDMLTRFLGEHVYIHDVGASAIEEFRARRLATGIAPATANRDIQILKRLFNLAILRGYRDKGTNPCSGLPMLKIGTLRIRVMPPGEFAQLYRVAPDSYWRALLTTLYTTGLRRSEALHLTWVDIEFDQQRLTVARKQASGYVQRWNPKDHEQRTIPLPRQTADLLRAWRAVAPVGCPYVFMEPARWQYYRRAVESGRWRSDCHLVHNLLRRFQTLCRRVHLERYTLHDLRRSCLTHWARSLPMYVVQQLAGHSDMRTTQRYYLLVQPQDLLRAGAVQEALIGTVPAKHLIDPDHRSTRRRRAFPGSWPHRRPPDLAVSPDRRQKHPRAKHSKKR